MSKSASTISGVGGLAGLYGVYTLIHSTHHRSGWFWLTLGFAILLLAQIQTVQRALRDRNSAHAERDKALRAATQRSAERAPYFAADVYAKELFRGEAFEEGRQRAAEKKGQGS